MAPKQTLSFSQRNGLSPLPNQLELGYLSTEVRSLIWNEIYLSIMRTEENLEYIGIYLGGDWTAVLKDYYVRVLHKPVHLFSNERDRNVRKLSDFIFNAKFNIVFDFIEFVLQHPLHPPSLRNGIKNALTDGRAAYRVINGNTVTPIGTDEEAQAIEKGVLDAKHAKLDGASSHLLASAGSLRHGKWADSVRESISAVESVAVLLAPEQKTLGAALNSLQKSGHLHGALKDAFAKLYGFTSDEEGIRHALVYDDNAKVDEADALFMLGACAAFVSYLISKGRSAGLI